MLHLKKVTHTEPEQCLVSQCTDQEFINYIEIITLSWELGYKF